MPEPLCLEDHELLPLLNSEPMAASLKEHLTGCPSCRQRLARLQAEVQVLRASVQLGSRSREPSGTVDVSPVPLGSRDLLPGAVPNPAAPPPWRVVWAVAIVLLAAVAVLTWWLVRHAQ